MLIAIIIYFGTIHLGPDRLSTGNFLALSIALANVITAVLAVGYTLLDMLDLPPLYNRVRPILEAQPEFPAAVLEPVLLGGALSLNAVSFRYPGQDEGTKVLSDVSLQVRPGEFVAIIGASGSGKSTIMRLLLGFETPDSGTVTYDGRELSTLDLREVRRQIGVVLQNAQLLPGDIFNNIAGFAPGLTVEDAWQAARLAGLEDDIRLFPWACTPWSARRQQPLRRPAAAASDRPGHRPPPAHPDVRRGHERTRQPDPGHRHREHHPRTSRHHPRGHRPPLDHRHRRRPHLRGQARTDRPVR